MILYIRVLGFPKPRKSAINTWIVVLCLSHKLFGRHRRYLYCAYLAGSPEGNTGMRMVLYSLHLISSSIQPIFLLLCNVPWYWWARLSRQFFHFRLNTLEYNIVGIRLYNIDTYRLHSYLYTYIYIYMHA